VEGPGLTKIKFFPIKKKHSAGKNSADTVEGNLEEIRCKVINEEMREDLVI
jgi:hypothetical protein